MLLFLFLKALHRLRMITDAQDLEEGSTFPAGLAPRGGAEPI
ncbi:hypothetical protein J2X65_000581 [Ancylobacter sp. 3268]|nr:hypothetical protein [Ancylobacter sp. 3268]MDR6951233.1 hypothetical protein [Ancylobacter sp. 3268]